MGRRSFPGAALLALSIVGAVAVWRLCRLPYDDGATPTLWALLIVGIGTLACFLGGVAALIVGLRR